MKVVAFIPARYASTRLHAKVLADICGRTMIERVYERVKEAKNVSSVVIATDDERIMEAAASFGAAAIMTSKDHVSGTERIAEAVAGMAPEVEAGVEADVILNVQGDEPLIDTRVIDDTLRPFIDDTFEKEILMTTAKVLLDVAKAGDPNIVKVVTDKNGYALYFSRSPVPYTGHLGDGAEVKVYKHIGIYAYRRDFLLKLSKMKQAPLERAEKLEQLRVLENGFRIKVVETGYDPMSVDTPEDLEKVREIFYRTRPRT